MHLSCLKYKKKINENKLSWRILAMQLIVQLVKIILSYSGVSDVSAQVVFNFLKKECITASQKYLIFRNTSLASHILK